MDFLKLPLPKPTLDSLLEVSKDFAQTNGLCMRTASEPNCSDLAEVAPFTLTPTPFPEELFNQAVDVQPLMAELFFRVAISPSFLRSALADVVASDEFVKRQWNIYEQVIAQGTVQTHLLIQRSDYMLHQTNGELSLKQVEVNNIAASFGGLASKCTLWHRYCLAWLGYQSKDIDKMIPRNHALNTVARGLFEAWTKYTETNRATADKTAIVFVVTNEDRNIFDQRALEFEIQALSHPMIPILRLTLHECFERMTTQDGAIYIDDLQVAVFYFRAGYVPNHYPSEAEWSARKTIELSKAIKCPTIALQLANTKKVQQVLSLDGSIEKFFSDEAKCASIRRTFAKQWGLERDNPELVGVVQGTLDKPDNFVLKPQLEGGGSNIYGKNIHPHLTSLSPAQREAYILMERLNPHQTKSYFVRSRSHVKLAEQAISEAGFYGFLIGDDRGQVGNNVAGGHLLRTKSAEVNEGGIMAGAAHIDSPLILPLNSFTSN